MPSSLSPLSKPLEEEKLKDDHYNGLPLQTPSTATTNDLVSSPLIASILMYLTYLSGATGLPLAILGLKRTPPSLTLGTLLTVGVGGGLSFLRHSVFHRSDAKRMKWDIGQTNNFQIEVGLANLAWSILGLASVICHWGLAAQAASFLVFGLYLDACTLFLIASYFTNTNSSSSSKRRPPPWGLVFMGAFGGVMSWVGVRGIDMA